MRCVWAEVVVVMVVAAAERCSSEPTRVKQRVTTSFFSVLQCLESCFYCFSFECFTFFGVKLG